MNENEATIGTKVRIVDPTLVVAFTSEPRLWTAGVYVITDATRPTYSYPEGIVAVRPMDGPRVAFRVAVENLVADINVGDKVRTIGETWTENVNGQSVILAEATVATVEKVISSEMFYVKVDGRGGRKVLLSRYEVEAV